MGIVTTLVIILFIIFFLNRYFLSYWRRHRIPQNDNPNFLIGDIKKMFSGKSTIYDILHDIYMEKKSSKVFGIYLSYRPVLVINDPVLIQDVLIKDFNTFHDRGLPINEEKDILSAHLFTLGGQKWRDLRVKLGPVFSSGKLKGMYPLIQNSAKDLEKHLMENVKKGNDVFEFRDLCARLTIDIISSVAFGVDSHCINDKNSAFRDFAGKIFEKCLRMLVIGSLMIFCPKLFSKLKFRSVPLQNELFVTEMVKNTVEYREKNDVKRKDLMQLLIQLKNDGYVSVDRDEQTEKQQQIRKFTMNDIAAQCYLFFIGGFDTSSSTMTFCLYEFCKNQEIQSKVHSEIDKILENSEDGDFSYEMLNDMKYLECCINESLRIYPIAPLLMRETNKDYTFSGTNLTVEKDTMILIPLLGLHHDPDIFENPMEFNPDRFLDSPTGSGKSKGSFYLPFGDGPRRCIGERMGKIQAKLGLATILSKFHVEFAEKQVGNIKFDPTNHFLLATDQPFNFKITSRF
ncbi:hypothetical protein ACKWTF_005515 [Chironomus riparius]